MKTRKLNGASTSHRSSGSNLILVFAITLCTAPWPAVTRAEPGSNAGASTVKSPRIPGTATILVQARGADGTLPRGAQCHFQTGAQAQPASVAGDGIRSFRPTVLGADGDWTIYNVLPGRWSVSVSGAEFAWTHEANVRELEIEDAPSVANGNTNHPTQNPAGRILKAHAGETTRLFFTLLQGATVTGRVIDAENGQPVVGVRVVGPPGSREDTTDAEGKFAVKHLPTREPVPLAIPARERLPLVTVTAWSDAYIAQCSDEVPAQEGQAVTVADIQLRRGGWISGQVVRPPGAPEQIMAMGNVNLHMEGEAPKGCVIPSAHLASDGSFRTRPMPPGRYALEAYLSTGKPSRAEPVVRRWHGKLQGVEVGLGQETKGVAIKLDRIED